MNTSSLLWGVLFGAVGLGFFVYGRRQKSAMPFICGFGLMVVPYFIDNVYILVAVGAALMAAPYFIRL